MRFALATLALLCACSTSSSGLTAKPPGGADAGHVGTQVEPAADVTPAPEVPPATPDAGPEAAPAAPDALAEVGRDAGAAADTSPDVIATADARSDGYGDLDNSSTSFEVSDMVDLGTIASGTTAPVVILVKPTGQIAPVTCSSSSTEVSLKESTCPSGTQLTAPCSVTFSFVGGRPGKRDFWIVCTSGADSVRTVVTANVVGT